MGRNFALTDSQVRRAAELYRDGYSRRQIGDYFGVSDTAAKNALRLAGVQMRERKAAATLGLQHWSRSRKRVSSVFALGCAPVRTVAHQMQEGTLE